MVASRVKSMFKRSDNTSSGSNFGDASGRSGVGVGTGVSNGSNSMFYPPERTGTGSPAGSFRALTGGYGPWNGGRRSRSASRTTGQDGGGGGPATLGSSGSGGFGAGAGGNGTITEVDEIGRPQQILPQIENISLVSNHPYAAAAANSSNSSPGGSGPQVVRPNPIYPNQSHSPNNDNNNNNNNNGTQPNGSESHSSSFQQQQQPGLSLPPPNPTNGNGGALSPSSTFSGVGYQPPTSPHQQRDYFQDHGGQSYPPVSSNHQHMPTSQAPAASPPQPQPQTQAIPQPQGITFSAGRKADDGKLSVGIDFGTTFSGVAYASSRLQSPFAHSIQGSTSSSEIRQILNWPGSYETYRKVPTCLLYSLPFREGEEAKVVAWGLEAKNATVGDGMLRCEWFKLYLEPAALRDGVPDPRLPALPPGKEPIDVIVDYLTCLWDYARHKITEDIGSVADLDCADVILTVPAAWDAAGCSLMREAAIKAGMVMNSGPEDKNWRDRLRIITEPEAAAIHASTLSSLHRLRISQSFIICDAGGGTVDTAVYRLIGNLAQLEIAETCTRSGASCGSLFLDLRFRDLVRNILRDHPIHLDAPSLASFMHSFSEIDKLAYRGEMDDHTLFRFTTFNVEDGYDPAIGLENGELAIPGHILRREVFDPVVDQVMILLDSQTKKAAQKIDCIILVGGFSASEYLYHRVQQAFGPSVNVIARPQDCDIATLQGASRYGLGLRGGKAWVSSVISPRAYCMKVKLPAEPQDYVARPAYIVRNDAGIEVCENRLQYLVQKGAVLKRGQRVKTRFCKYARGPADSFFTAVMYTSDTPSVFRYSDEGETFELCRWTVDLSALPDFGRRSRQPGGAYLEFDLGLELDSAEVRGVLLTDDGRECGKAVFDFLGT